jgi:hypothetical protein
MRAKLARGNCQENLVLLHKFIGLFVHQYNAIELSPILPRVVVRSNNLGVDFGALDLFIAEIVPGRTVRV